MTIERGHRRVEPHRLEPVAHQVQEQLRVRRRPGQRQRDRVGPVGSSTRVSVSRTAACCRPRSRAESRSSDVLSAKSSGSSDSAGASSVRTSSTTSGSTAGSSRVSSCPRDQPLGPEPLRAEPGDDLGGRERPELAERGQPERPQRGDDVRGVLQRLQRQARRARAPSLPGAHAPAPGAPAERRRSGPAPAR